MFVMETTEVPYRAWKMGAGSFVGMGGGGGASMHESVHLSTGSVSKFREHETIDRKGEIREMRQAISAFPCASVSKRV